MLSSGQRDEHCQSRHIDDRKCSGNGLKIFKVFRQVRATCSDGKVLISTGGTKLRSVIFIMIESGIILFSI